MDDPQIQGGDQIFRRHGVWSPSISDTRNTERQRQRERHDAHVPSRQAQLGSSSARQSRTWKLQWSSEGCKRIPDCSAAAMATNLIARSHNAAGLPRCLNALSRSISVLLFEQGSSQAWVGRAGPGEGTQKQVGQHGGSHRIGLPAGRNVYVGLAMRGAKNTVTNLPLVKMPWVMGFSTRVAPIEEADPEASNRQREVNFRGDEKVNPLKGSSRTERESPLFVDKWLVSAQLRKELLCFLRALPLEADLDKHIKNGTFAGAKLTASDIREVVSALVHNGRLKPARFSPHLDSEQRDGPADVLVDTSVSRVTVPRSGADNSAFRAYDATGDAKRALNLVKWWQRRSRDQVPFNLLNNVLLGLARANLTEDIVGIKEKYKTTQHEGVHIASSLIAAYSIMGLSQKVVDIYSEAQERSWPLTVRAVEKVFKALVDLKVSPGVLLFTYKNSPKRFVMKSSTYALMLERGVRVDDIRWSFIRCPTPVATGLIEALISLGRKSEAAHLVSDLVSGQPRLTPGHLVNLMVVLVKAGFSKEAQAIARMQESKYDVSIANGLLGFLDTEHRLRGATETYQALMKLEGPHRQSVAVHASAVKAYFLTGHVDGLYEVSSVSYASWPCVTCPEDSSQPVLVHIANYVLMLRATVLTLVSFC